MDIDLVSTEKKVDALTYQIWNFGANLLNTLQNFIYLLPSMREKIFVKNSHELYASMRIKFFLIHKAHLRFQLKV